MIFVYHFMPFNSPKYPQAIKEVVGGFHIGVDLFFVLSGFLITYRYFNDHPIHFTKYIVNRVARIYPMYFLVTLAVFVVWYFQNQTWDSLKSYEFLFSITMTKALFTQFYLKGIPQGWTLTLEEMFYFTAPLYFILVRKSKFWLVILPILIFIFGMILKNISNVPSNLWGFLQSDIYTYIIEFFSGIGLGYLILKKKFSFKIKGFTWFGLAMIALYLLGRNYLGMVINLKSDVGRFTEMGLLSIFGIAPLLYGLIFEKTIVQKILSTRAFVLLGKSSYVFYLIHKGFIPVFINDYISDNKLVIFILLNLLSILLFISIEEPLNNWIRKTFNKRKKVE